MNIGSVMDDLGAGVDTIAGLRVFAYWAGSITPPAAVVGFPEDVTYDETMGRGMDRFTVPVFIVTDQVDPRTGRDQLSQYAVGSGSTSVKAAIEAYAATAYHRARVMRVEFGSTSIGGTDYLSATFFVDVLGAGT